MKKILITGGAGYLGSILTETLLKEGHSVTILDNLSYNQLSLSGFCSNENFNLVLGDVRNESLLEKLVNENEVVIPLAAIVGMPACKSNPQAAIDINLNQIKNVIKFIEQVLNDLNSYISVKKAAKAPRARKAVPVEKIVAKLKYQKVFKDTASKLDLVSISPIKLHGASEAWIYDSAKRKLHHYIADDYSKAFTVKGNTLLGFDTAQSEVKTLRKPAEQIKEVMGSKPVARKYFKDIKAVATVPNGRFNENMIILKAF